MFQENTQIEKHRKEDGKIVFLETESSIKNEYYEQIKDIANIISMSSAESMLNYIVNDTGVDIVIIHPTIIDTYDFSSLIYKIDKINPTIVKIVIEVNDNWRKSYQDIIRDCKVEVIGSDMLRKELPNFISNIIRTKKEKRKFSRIDTPINATIIDEVGAIITSDAKIISISGGGAYINIENFDVNTADKIMLNIYFSEFTLLTNVNIVWTNDKNQRPSLPPGFAVMFVNVSAVSQRIVDNIVKTKLLKTIMFEYDHSV